MGEKDSQRLTTLTISGPYSNDVGVLPLGETALARQFEFSALRGLETTQPRPMMTGPTKSEDRWGIKLPHHWNREFPRSPEGARTGAMSGDLGSESELRVSS